MSNPTPTPLDYGNPKHMEPRGPSAKKVIAWTFGVLIGLGLLVSILTPNLVMSRERARRVKCALNLKQIGQAMLLYANENRGEMVPDWPTLLATQDIVPEVFICASSELDKATGSTTQQIAQNLLEGGHLSYALVSGQQKWSNSSDEILAFDLRDHVAKDSAVTTGINVLLGDGSVQFVDEKIAGSIRARYFAGVRPIRLSDCSAATAAATQTVSRP